MRPFDDLPLNSIERRMNVYLKRKYDITLEERNLILKEQGHKCACCGRMFDEKTRMEIDHEHFKVIARRSNASDIDAKGWYATAFNKTRTLEYIMWAKTKQEAVKKAKRVSLRASVRGILCGGRYAGCNRKLGRIDDIPWMQKCLAYLQDPPARRILKQLDSFAEGQKVVT